MYSIKRLILRLLEVYHNNPNTVKGRIKFFNAWQLAYCYDSLANKAPYNLNEINKRNAAFRSWLEDSEKVGSLIEINMQRSIENDYNLITTVLASIKEDSAKAITEFYMNRKKVAGCVGRVVY